MIFTGPIHELPLFQYTLIHADPPWLFDLRSERGEAKSPQAQYACMPTDQICDLPVGHLARGDAILFLWATAPMLWDARRVMAAWGAKYVTMGCWAKQSSTGKKWTFGPGYWFRSACEPFLLGVWGNPSPICKTLRNLIVAPVRGHSRKPDEAYAHCEKLSHGPYLDLFSRQPRDGWDTWGNEATKFQEAA